MTFREWNRRKNLYLRGLKAKAGKFLFDKKNPNRFTPHQLKSIKKIVFLRNDNKLGDMIVNTAAFREIKKALPKAEITVIAGPSSAQIIENNRNISQIMICKKALRHIIKTGLALRRQNIDLYIDMDKQPTFDTLLLLRLINPRFAFGFNREDFKSYNITIPFDFKASHVTQWQKQMLKALRLKKEEKFNPKYDLFIPTEAKKASEKFLKTLPPYKKTIIFNPFASSKHRCFSPDQLIRASANFPKANIILVGPQEKINIFSAEEPLPSNIYKISGDLLSKFGVWGIIALVNKADLIITPDTYLIHVAASFGKPICAVYAPGDGKSWYPLTQNHKIETYDKDFALFDITKILDGITL